MKILALMGSPRKGNTYKLVQQIESYIKKCSSDIDFEYLFLTDYKLEACKGCFLCVSKGQHLCPIKDNRTEIEDKLKASDGVIFASPVYNFNVSGLMKNFFDRMSYMCHRPNYFDKYAMAVTTSGGGGIPETLKYITMISKAWGFRFVNKLGIMNHPAVNLTEKTTKRIEKAAEEFYSAIQNKKEFSLGLTDLIQFRIMKANSIGSKQYFPADYEFYKDKRDYYTNRKIGLFRNTAAKVLERFIIKMIESNA